MQVEFVIDLFESGSRHNVVDKVHKVFSGQLAIIEGLDEVPDIIEGLGLFLLSLYIDIWAISITFTVIWALSFTFTVIWALSFTFTFNFAFSFILSTLRVVLIVNIFFVSTTQERDITNKGNANITLSEDAIWVSVDMLEQFHNVGFTFRSQLFRIAHNLKNCFFPMIICHDLLDSARV